MLHSKKFSRAQIETYLFFFILLALGIFMRFYNLNWDQGYLFHPDERNIANAVTKIQFFTQLNPGFFAYGGFSIYLYRAAADMLVFITKDPSWVSDWGKINLVGRFFSALFSSLTLLPIFFLTKKLFKTITAFFATIFWVFTVSSIQLSHFATTESLLTLEAVSLVYLSLLLYEKLTLRRILLSAMLFGISLATKTSAFLFILPILIAYFLSFFKQKPNTKIYITHFVYFVLFSIISFGIFFVFSPYTFLDAKDFFASMHYESGVATGSLPVVYTLQFTGTIPYVFQIQQFFWQIGLLTIFGVLGFILLLWKAIPKKLFVIHNTSFVLSIFLIFPLVYFLYVGSWHTKFIRYMLPFLPFFVICGSWLLISVYEKFQRIGTSILLVILTTTLLWSLAFFSIYTNPQTRITASKWIYQHIPAGSKVSTEHWDDGLPIAIEQFSPSQYQAEPLTIYEPDGSAKLHYYGEKLSQGEYIIINSRRLYGTLTRLTKQYPLTSKYYTDLFSGKLGYDNLAQFYSYPRLGPFIINDDGSEETFQVYDHPKVLVFQNTKHFSANQIMQILETQ